MLRILGYVFLLAALAAIAVDIWLGMSGGGEVRLRPVGEWWFWLDRDSIQVLQPAIERHVSVDLWVYVVQPLLEWPLAVELGVLGAVLWLLGRARA